jgi:TPR repeat protein
MPFDFRLLNRQQLNNVQLRLTIGVFLIAGGFFVDQSSIPVFKREDSTTWTFASAYKARHTDPQAMFLIARSYEQGTAEINQSIEEASEWYTKAAENGHLGAMAWLAQFNKEKDPSLSVKWLKAAIEKGDFSAAPLLARFYFSGYGSEKPNFKEGLNVLELGAQGGNPQSMFLIAKLLYETSPKNKVRAAMWLQEAIAKEPDPKTKEKWALQLDLWVSLFSINDQTDFSNALLEKVAEQQKNKKDSLATLVEQLQSKKP